MSAETEMVQPTLEQTDSEPVDRSWLRNFLRPDRKPSPLWYGVLALSLLSVLTGLLWLYAGWFSRQIESPEAMEMIYSTDVPLAGPETPRPELPAQESPLLGEQPDSEAPAGVSSGAALQREEAAAFEEQKVWRRLREQLDGRHEALVGRLESLHLEMKLLCGGHQEGLVLLHRLEELLHSKVWNPPSDQPGPSSLRPALPTAGSSSSAEPGFRTLVIKQLGKRAHVLVEDSSGKRHKMYPGTRWHDWRLVAIAPTGRQVVYDGPDGQRVEVDL